MPEIISKAAIYETKNLFCERFYLFKKFRTLKLISAPEIERNVRKDNAILTCL